jgi:RecB family endonuclease NucS
VIRLVIATCSVDYEGRLTAHLPEATRLLTVKREGSHYIREPKRSR